MIKPVLYIDQILRWADAFHRRWGRWPKKDSGVIPGALSSYGNRRTATPVYGAKA